MLCSWQVGIVGLGKFWFFRLSSGKLVIPRNCRFKFCWLCLVLKKKPRNKVKICTTIFLGEFSVCLSRFVCLIQVWVAHSWRWDDVLVWFACIRSYEINSYLFIFIFLAILDKFGTGSCSGMWCTFNRYQVWDHHLFVCSLL